MPPNIQVAGRVPKNEDVASPIEYKQEDTYADSDKKDAPKLKIVWRNVIIMSYLHVAAVYGVYLCWTSAKWQTTATGKIVLQS